MTILAATIWAIGTLFTWGYCNSLYRSVPTISRKDKVLMLIAVPLAWPAILGVSVECRTIV